MSIAERLSKAKQGLANRLSGARQSAGGALSDVLDNLPDTPVARSLRDFGPTVVTAATAAALTPGAGANPETAINFALHAVIGGAGAEVEDRLIKGRPVEADEDDEGSEIVGAETQVDRFLQRLDGALTAQLLVDQVGAGLANGSVDPLILLTSAATKVDEVFGRQIQDYETRKDSTLGRYSQAGAALGIWLAATKLSAGLIATGENSTAILLWTQATLNLEQAARRLPTPEEQLAHDIRALVRSQFDATHNARVGISGTEHRLEREEGEAQIARALGGLVRAPDITLYARTTSAAEYARQAKVFWTQAHRVLVGSKKDQIPAAISYEDVMERLNTLLESDAAEVELPPYSAKERAKAKEEGIALPTTYGELLQYHYAGLRSRALLVTLPGAISKNLDPRVWRAGETDYQQFVEESQWGEWTKGKKAAKKKTSAPHPVSSARRPEVQAQVAQRDSGHDTAIARPTSPRTPEIIRPPATMRPASPAPRPMAPAPGAARPDVASAPRPMTTEVVRPVAPAPAAVRPTESQSVPPSAPVVARPDIQAPPRQMAPAAPRPDATPAPRAQVVTELANNRLLAIADQFKTPQIVDALSLLGDATVSKGLDGQPGIMPWLMTLEGDQAAALLHELEDSEDNVEFLAKIVDAYTRHKANGRGATASA